MKTAAIVWCLLSLVLAGCSEFGAVGGPAVINRTDDEISLTIHFEDGELSRQVLPAHGGWLGDAFAHRAERYEIKRRGLQFVVTADEIARKKSQDSAEVVEIAVTDSGVEILTRK